MIVIPAEAGIHCFCHSERSEESPFDIQYSLFGIRYSFLSFPRKACSACPAPNRLMPQFGTGSEAEWAGIQSLGSLKHSLGMAPLRNTADLLPV